MPVFSSTPYVVPTGPPNPPVTMTALFSLNGNVTSTAAGFIGGATNGGLYLYQFVIVGGTRTLTPDPSAVAWSKIMDTTQAANLNMQVWATVFTTGDSNSPTWTVSGAPASFAGSTFESLDHGVVTPTIDIVVSTNQGTSANPSYSGASLATNGDMLLRLAGTATSLATPNPPAGHTQLFAPGAWAGVYDYSVYLTDQTPGAKAPIGQTIVAGSRDWVYSSLVIPT